MLNIIIIVFIKSVAYAGGGVQTPSSEPDEIVVEIEFFYWIFIKNFQNFLKTSQVCSFRPNALKINAWFVKFFEKYAKLMDFSKFSKEIFWKFSKISQNFQTMCFSSKRAKLTHDLLNFFGKYAKIMHFLQFSQ